MIKKLDCFFVGLFQPLVNKTLDSGRNIARFLLYVAYFLCLMTLVHFAASQTINIHFGKSSLLSVACEAVGFFCFFIFMIWFFVGNFSGLVKKISDVKYGIPVTCNQMKKESLSGVILRSYGVVVLLTIIPAMVFKLVVDFGKLHDMWSYIALVSDLSFMLEHVAFIVLVFASGCRYRRPFNEEEFQEAYS